MVKFTHNHLSHRGESRAGTARKSEVGGRDGGPPGGGVVCGGKVWLYPTLSPI